MAKKKPIVKIAKKKPVVISVDERFFRIFEVERQKQQSKLRLKLGGVFNLSQRKFTALLGAKNFKFTIPKQKSFGGRRKRR